MRIGMLSSLSGCSSDTIRYYEKIGLLPAPVRLVNGYRHYDERHYKWLLFILRSRALGFTQAEVRLLSSIAQQSERACSEVRELLLKHIADIRTKLRDLKRMKKALLRLESMCRDGSLPDCPVIDELLH